MTVALTVTPYRFLLLLKFVGVVLYAGGMIACFVAKALPERKRAVHAVASPGLVITWAAGYMLTMMQDIALTELWVMGGLLLSFASHLALLHSVARDQRTPKALLTAAVPLFLVLVLMVFRPVWAGVRS